MIIEQFLINKAKEIDNPISNWGIGFTAEVIREWIDLQVKVKKLFIYDVSSSADFKANARPLLKYLAENHHPHTTAIITSTSIELVEGIKAENKIYDYIQD